MATQKQDELKQRLLARKEALKQELKTKHPDLYDWLVEHRIDLDHLGRYAKNITLALLLAAQQIGTTPVPVGPPPQPQVVETLSPDTQRARDVWDRYGNTIVAVAEKYGVDPRLIFATIMTESGGNPMAFRAEPRINDASYGLSQMLYGTALGLGFRGGPRQMYEPIIAIDLIARYHRRSMDTYGELGPEQLTIVYNTGSLFKKPHPQHLTRFRSWYDKYPGKTLLAGSQTAEI